ncbi:MAG: NFACT family protein [Candidatus Thermoplasmatota archaeon]|nr:NFACT family protein [Candidatus Thermoplasmatota archaeon]
MKYKESSLDIYAFVNCYQDEISGSFIKKIHQVSQDEFIFQIYRSDVKRRSLFLSLSKGIAFHDVQTPETPSNMAMTLRSMLEDRKIISIYQINFDRILGMDLSGGLKVILEVFREGNLIVLQDNIIKFAYNQREWKNRTIARGSPYNPPESHDPTILDPEGCALILRNSKANIVQTLATRFNLGGEMAEEVAFRMGLDKNTQAASFARIDDLRNAISGILQESRNNRGFLYSKSDIVSPVILNHLQEEPERVFDSFAEALDYYLQNYPEGEAKESPMQKRIRSIEKSIEEFKSNSEKFRKQGEFIFSNLKSIEVVIEAIRNQENRVVKDFKLFPGCTVISIDPARKRCQVDLNGNILDLQYNRKPSENGNIAFQEAKDFHAKIEGAEKAIEEARKQVVPAQKAQRKKMRKTFWFETYRWFFTSEGNLVLAGKDRKSNEKVVKKHMKQFDLYVHADLYGAPSTIVKGTDTTRPSEISARESCQFAVCFSRAWPAGQLSGSAYWVYPEQVSKTAESGEYVTSGSWVIRGKRNYFFDLPMHLYLGKINYSGEILPMVSPIPFESQGKLIEIMPGKTRRDEVARKIREELETSLEEIERLLPPGTSDIV